MRKQDVIDVSLLQHETLGRRSLPVVNASDAAGGLDGVGRGGEGGRRGGGGGGVGGGGGEREGEGEEDSTNKDIQSSTTKKITV